MTKVADLPARGYKIIDRSSRMGRSSVLVRCDDCETSVWIYLWSWAGHGRARCGSGKHRLRFSNPSGDA